MKIRSKAALLAKAMAEADKLDGELTEDDVRAAQAVLVRTKPLFEGRPCTKRTKAEKEQYPMDETNVGGNPMNEERTEQDCAAALRALDAYQALSERRAEKEAALRYAEPADRAFDAARARDAAVKKALRAEGAKAENTIAERGQELAALGEEIPQTRGTVASGGRARV